MLKRARGLSVLIFTITYIKEEKTMKTTITKKFAIALAAVMCASLAACKQSENGNDNGGGSGSISNSPLINNADEDKGEEPEDSGTESSEEEQEPESEGTDAEVEDVTTTEETPVESTLPEEEPEEDTESENDTENAEKDSETETTVITTTEAQQAAPSDKGEAVAKTAESAIGYDYLYGGESPEEGGFDNSGLIYYAFTQNGISCPRTISEIMKIGSEIGYGELSKGDAVFFKMDDGSDIVFGGVYAGDGKAVMSFSEGIPVKLVDITTNYYRSTFVCGIRAVS